MLDKMSKEVLRFLLEFCKDGSFQVLEYEEIIKSLSSNYNLDREGIMQILKHLNSLEYIIIKYNDDNVVCLSTLPFGRQYIESEEEKKKNILKMKNMARGAFISALFAALIGAFLGTLIYNIIFWGLLWVLDKKEKMVMIFLSEVCQSKRSYLISAQQIAEFVSKKYILSIAELDDIMISLNKDNYLDFIISDSKSGYFYVITLKNKGLTFKKDEKKKKKELMILFLRTLGITILSFVLGVLLKMIFNS